MFTKLFGLLHKGTVAAAAYALRTLFSGVSNQPVTLVNGQFLSDDDDGMGSGQLTVVDVSSGTINFDSTNNEMDFVGTDLWAQTGVISDGSTSAAGLTLYFKVDQSADAPSSIIGFLGSNADIANATFDVAINIGTALTLTDIYMSGDGFSTNQQFIDDLATGVYEYALVIDNTNSLGFGYIKGVAYTSWTLFGIVSISSLAATLYGGISHNTSGNNLLVDSFQCDESLLNTGAITPIIHDAFGGSGATDGRTPDTVNQGDTWHNTGFTLSDGVVASGYVESDGDGSVVLRTNCGQDDQYSITNGTINNTTTSNSRFGNLHRVQDTSDDGFPTDCVRCMLVPLTNELQIIERIAGSNTTTSTAFTVVGATTYDLHSWVVGTKAFAQVNGTSVSATLGTITSGTQCGVELAAQTSIPHTLVNDHKTYKANGVTINV